MNVAINMDRFQSIYDYASFATSSISEKLGGVNFAISDEEGETEGEEIMSSMIKVAKNVSKKCGQAARYGRKRSIQTFRRITDSEGFEDTEKPTYKVRRRKSKDDKWKDPAGDDKIDDVTYTIEVPPHRYRDGGEDHARNGGKQRILPSLTTTQPQTPSETLQQQPQPPLPSIIPPPPIFLPPPRITQSPQPLPPQLPPQQNPQTLFLQWPPLTTLPMPAPPPLLPLPLPAQPQVTHFPHPVPHVANPQQYPVRDVQLPSPSTEVDGQAQNPSTLSQSTKNLPPQKQPCSAMNTKITHQQDSRPSCPSKKNSDDGKTVNFPLCDSDQSKKSLQSTSLDKPARGSTKVSKCCVEKAIYRKLFEMMICPNTCKKCDDSFRSGREELEPRIPPCSCYQADTDDFPLVCDCPWKGLANERPKRFCHKRTGNACFEQCVLNADKVKCCEICYSPKYKTCFCKSIGTQSPPWDDTEVCCCIQESLERVQTSSFDNHSKVGKEFKTIQFSVTKKSKKKSKPIFLNVDIGQLLSVFGRDVTKSDHTSSTRRRYNKEKGPAIKSDCFFENEQKQSCHDARLSGKCERTDKCKNKSQSVLPKYVSYNWQASSSTDKQYSREKGEIERIDQCSDRFEMKKDMLRHIQTFECANKSKRLKRVSSRVCQVHDNAKQAESFHKRENTKLAGAQRCLRSDTIEKEEISDANFRQQNAKHLQGMQSNKQSDIIRKEIETRGNSRIENPNKTYFERMQSSKCSEAIKNGIESIDKSIVEKTRPTLFGRKQCKKQSNVIRKGIESPGNSRVENTKRVHLAGVQGKRRSDIIRKEIEFLEHSYVRGVPKLPCRNLCGTRKPVTAKIFKARDEAKVIPRAKANRSSPITSMKGAKEDRCHGRVKAVMIGMPFIDRFDDYSRQESAERQQRPACVNVSTDRNNVIPCVERYNRERRYQALDLPKTENSTTDGFRCNRHKKPVAINHIKNDSGCLHLDPCRATNDSRTQNRVKKSPTTTACSPSPINDSLYHENRLKDARQRLYNLNTTIESTRKEMKSTLERSKQIRDKFCLVKGVKGAKCKAQAKSTTVKKRNCPGNNNRWKNQRGKIQNETVATFLREVKSDIKSINAKNAGNLSEFLKSPESKGVCSVPMHSQDPGRQVICGGNQPLKKPIILRSHTFTRETGRKFANTMESPNSGTGTSKLFKVLDANESRMRSTTSEESEEKRNTERANHSSDDLNTSDYLTSLELSALSKQCDGAKSVSIERCETSVENKDQSENKETERISCAPREPTPTDRRSSLYSSESNATYNMSQSPQLSQDQETDISSSCEKSKSENSLQGNISNISNISKDDLYCRDCKVGGTSYDTKLDDGKSETEKKDGNLDSDETVDDGKSKTEKKDGNVNSDETVDDGKSETEKKDGNVDSDETVDDGKSETEKKDGNVNSDETVDDGKSETEKNDGNVDIDETVSEDSTYNEVASLTSEENLLDQNIRLSHDTSEENEEQTMTRTENNCVQYKLSDYSVSSSEQKIVLTPIGREVEREANDEHQEPKTWVESPPEATELNETNKADGKEAPHLLKKSHMNSFDKERKENAFLYESSLRGVVTELCTDDEINNRKHHYSRCNVFPKKQTSDPKRVLTDRIASLLLSKIRKGFKFESNKALNRDNGRGNHISFYSISQCHESPYKTPCLECDRRCSDSETAQTTESKESKIGNKQNLTPLTSSRFCDWNIKQALGDPYSQTENLDVGYVANTKNVREQCCKSKSCSQSLTLIPCTRCTELSKAPKLCRNVGNRGRRDQQPVQKVNQNGHDQKTVLGRKPNESSSTTQRSACCNETILANTGCQSSISKKHENEPKVRDYSFKSCKNPCARWQASEDVRPKIKDVNSKTTQVKEYQVSSSASHFSNLSTKTDIKVKSVRANGNISRTKQSHCGSDNNRFSDSENNPCFSINTKKTPVEKKARVIRITRDSCADSFRCGTMSGRCTHPCKKNNCKNIKLKNGSRKAKKTTVSNALHTSGIDVKGCTPFTRSVKPKQRCSEPYLSCRVNDKTEADDKTYTDCGGTDIKKSCPSRNSLITDDELYWHENNKNDITLSTLTLSSNTCDIGSIKPIPKTRTTQVDRSCASRICKESPAKTRDKFQNARSSRSLHQRGTNTNNEKLKCTSQKRKRKTNCVFVEKNGDKQLDPACITSPYKTPCRVCVKNNPENVLRQPSDKSTDPTNQPPNEPTTKRCLNPWKFFGFSRNKESKNDVASKLECSMEKQPQRRHCSQRSKTSHEGPHCILDGTENLDTSSHCGTIRNGRVPCRDANMRSQCDEGQDENIQGKMDSFQYARVCPCNAQALDKSDYGFGHKKALPKCPCLEMKIQNVIDCPQKTLYMRNKYGMSRQPCSCNSIKPLIVCDDEGYAQKFLNVKSCREGCAGVQRFMNKQNKVVLCVECGGHCCENCGRCRTRCLPLCTCRRRTKQIQACYDCLLQRKRCISPKETELLPANTVSNPPCSLCGNWTTEVDPMQKNRIHRSFSVSSFCCHCNSHGSSPESHLRENIEYRSITMNYSNTKALFKSIHQRCKILKSVLTSSALQLRSKAARKKAKSVLKLPVFNKSKNNILERENFENIKSPLAYSKMS